MFVENLVNTAPGAGRSFKAAAARLLGDGSIKKGFLKKVPLENENENENGQKETLASAADELRASLQGVFALTEAPPDAAEKLHRAVDNRLKSWAFGDERSLTYLLACFGRLGAAYPSAAQALAKSTSSSDVALSGGNGSGLKIDYTASPIINGIPTGYSLLNGGTNYSTTSFAFTSGGSGSGLRVSIDSVSGGSINSISIIFYYNSAVF